jgi:tRNA threonylcarbamoyl adenosine modification protein YeaZ
MVTLAIDTAGFACSVALYDGQVILAERHEVIQRGHAERLMPLIADLPNGGRADRIIVGCGPGSFTGVRVGIAAARALGLGWNIPVTGCESLTLLAAGYFESYPTATAVTVVVEGGHGEVFVQPFTNAPFEAQAPLQSVPYADAVAVLAGQILTGNAAERFDASGILSHTRAASARLLPDDMTVLPPSPRYGRAPDAKPMSV